MKYKKKNWLKLKVKLYEFGSSFGNYQKVIFFKGKDFVMFDANKTLVEELKKHKLATEFYVWFKTKSVVSKSGHWFTSNTMFHYELYVPMAKKMEDEHNYKNGLNGMFGESSEV